MNSRSVSNIRLWGPWLTLAHAAWLVCAGFALFTFIVSIPKGYLLLLNNTYHRMDAPAWYVAAISSVAGISLIAVLVGLGLSVVLFWKRRDEPMALLVSFYLLGYVTLAGPLEALGFTNQNDYPAISQLVNELSLVLLLLQILLLYLFPNGRFVPRWMRWVSFLLLLFFAPSILYSGSDAWADFPNPQLVLGMTAYGALVGVGIYAQIYRYRHAATPMERQQIKWAAFGISLSLFFEFLAGILWVTLWEPNLPVNVEFSNPAWIAAEVPWRLAKLILPLGLAIAVMRYRLWDIDFIINRALVYGTLTGIVVGAFVILVGFLGSLFQSGGNSIVAIVATGLVALLFNPLRQQLQRGINHLMYGQRDEPYTALSRLGQRLEAAYAPESVLPTIVETLAQTLKLPYVGITLNQDGEFKTAAEFGRSKNNVITLPLAYQGEPVGELILAPRAPGEHFTAAERLLLEDLARQAGVAAHAVRLTADLQRSRERLVTAREEERRRLRRDLHDGLGPQLAGLALKLETLRNRLNGDPLADSLLADLAKRTQDATADIRHLVYELRPPTLDELGLVSALRESAEQYNQQEVNRLNISFDAPDSLPALPAAVEVAVYRIAQEALTNVIRHAEAHTCRVRLVVDESAGLLCLEVQDDGKGMSMKRRAGVGLNSMRERAEELGGMLAVTSSEQGTLLTARLPCKLTQFNRSIAADISIDREG